MALAIILPICAAFAIFCGAQLFMMQSELYDIIHRFGRSFGTILALAVVLIFLFRIAYEALGFWWTTGLSLAFCAGFLLLELGIAFLEKKLLVLKKEGERQVLPSNAFATSTTLDALSAIIAGLAIGVSFHLGYGLELIMLVPLAVLMILQCVGRITAFEQLVISQKSIYANLFVVLAGLVAGLIFGAFLPKITGLGDKAIIAPMSYMIYLFIWNGRFLVMSWRK